VESLAASDGRAGPIVDGALRIVFFIAPLVQALIERELRRAMRERGIHAHPTDKTAFDPW